MQETLISTTKIPVCLTVAGSDSGGGAGIQADLKTFSFFGTFGASVITAVTAQNPLRVGAIHPIPKHVVVDQFNVVTEALSVRAIKTGLLSTPETITAVAGAVQNLPKRLPLVIDPVMTASSGSRLATPECLDALTRYLIPTSTLVTPNTIEAELLLQKNITQYETPAMAAQELAATLGVSVLLKGGHLNMDEAAVDFLACEGNLYELKSPVAPTTQTHGTGCLLSAAILANLALGESLLSAVTIAKAYVYASLLTSLSIGSDIFAIGIPASIDRSVVKVSTL